MIFQKAHPKSSLPIVGLGFSDQNLSQVQFLQILGSRIHPLIQDVWFFQMHQHAHAAFPRDERYYKGVNRDFFLSDVSIKKQK